MPVFRNRNRGRRRDKFELSSLLGQPAASRSVRRSSRRIKFEPLEQRMVLAANVVISEILADNNTGLEDEDGDRGDWIELFNAGDMTADLGGWHLTDDSGDLGKWQFPDVTLAPDEYLVVFASDKNRTAPSGPLHTNFKLTSSGEYLALVEPDAATVAFEFAPKFPAQLTDLSFGLAQAADVTTFVGPQAPVSVLIPDNGALGTTWRNVGFDDSSWRQGATGVGYERNSGYENLIRLDVQAEMDGRRTTAYVRVPFTVESSDDFTSLMLRMQYDDGFVAFINGVRVAGANDPASLAWDSQATNNHDDGAAVLFQDFDITQHRDALVDGENILAIHGLNRGAGSSDFLLVPELTGVVAQDIQEDVRHFLSAPTPGGPNGVGAASVVDSVEFSVPGGVITGNVTLELSTTTPGAEIRYTLNGSLPGANSTLYTGPLTIGGSSTMVRAVAFAPDALPSRPVSQTYLALAANVQGFNSDLPVVILENFGGGSVPSSGFQTSSMTIFEQVDGRTTLTSDPTLQTRSGIRIRGSSTAGRPKKAYNVEAWDDNDHDKQISPLGLPEESDFILYAAYNFDKALMRNALIYDLSNQVGRYAARTRFVEVFVNTGGGAVSQSDYVGVYSFMEKIKRDNQRVDIQELTPFNNAAPEVTGGYILKKDRLDPGDSGFNGGGQQLAYVEPKETEITPQQAAWIKGYLDQFVSVLNGPNFTDPVNGYAKYIDVDSWIDHHILNVLPKNVDALRLSGYMYIDRLGKLEMGPIWDFDRSMESTDGRDNDPRTWNGTGDATRFFDYPWWDRLFQDPNFWQKWIDRWTELRRTSLSTENVHGTIDRMADEIREAQVRNFQKWSSEQPRFGSWQGEVNHLKNWLRDRLQWIDSNFVTAAAFSHAGGQVDPGFQLNVTNPAGTIYYTTDGSDPRLPGGAISPTANSLASGGTIAIDQSTIVTARVRSGSSWSGLTEATFLVGDPPSLRVTEIMYHPAAAAAGSPYNDDDFEFIELQNVGASAISLAGMSFGDGVQFAFPDVELAAGGRVVVVANQEAFEARYGVVDGVIGQYTGQLDNTGERLALLGAFEEVILGFEFDDAWYPDTDGAGHSLVIVDPLADPATWGQQASWQPSVAIGGSPGAAEPAGVPGDTNGDGIVNIDDLNNVRNNFGGAGLGDTNADGVVDIDDLNNVRNNFGAGAAAGLSASAEHSQSGATAGLSSIADAVQTKRRELRVARRRVADVGATAGLSNSADPAHNSIAALPAQDDTPSVRTPAFRSARGHLLRAGAERATWDMALLDLLADDVGR